MPAVSKSQARLFGMIHAYKTGRLKNASKSVKEAAKGMSDSTAKEFAATKHKGLPETTNILHQVAMGSGSALRSLVKQSKKGGKHK